MTKRFKRPAGLVGASGLTAAVIAQATVDAINSADRDNMLDAWAYLGGVAYQRHTDALGLSPDTWPAALDTMGNDDFIRITDRILGR